MTNSVKNLSLMASVLLALTGCGGGGSSETVNPPTSTNNPPTSTNNPPTIDVAQPSQVIEAGQTSVTLSIVANDDSGVSSIAWSQSSGTSVSLENANSAQASFVVPRVSLSGGEQQLTFNVVVTDTDGATAQSELSVLLKSNNQLPVIIASQPNQTVEVAGEEVMLEITATDDSQVSQIQWSQTSGTSVSIDNAGAEQARFIAPAYSENEADNVLTFEVKVTDDDGDSAEQTLTVNIFRENILPVVQITAPEEIEALSEYVITVEASDSDGEIVSYLWEYSNEHFDDVEFSQDEHGTLTFIAPPAIYDGEVEFTLTVTDDKGGQTTVVYVEPVIPLRPRFDEVNISATNVTSGQEILIDWQVRSSGQIRLVELSRADTGKKEHLDFVDESSASIVVPLVLEQSQEVEFVLTATDHLDFTGEARFSLTIEPFTGKFAPASLIFSKFTWQSEPFGGFETMGSFGEKVVVQDHDVAPEQHGFNFINGQLVIDETFDSRPWEGHTYSMHHWLNVDYDQDGIGDVIAIANAVAENSIHMGVMLGDENGNLSPLIELGIVESNLFLEINGFEDVNGDGQRDLRLILRCNVTNCNPNKELFAVYHAATQTFVAMEDSSAVEPDLSSLENANYKVFVDLDSDGKNEMIGMNEISDNCANAPLCGNLRSSSMNEQNQYQDWTNFESRYLSGNSLIVRDVDLDGKDDLVFDGFEHFSTGATATSHWYRYEQDGSITTIPMPIAPKYYVDLFATGKPYFVDLTTQGKLTTYRYDEASNLPVVDTVYDIAPGAKDNLLFMDLDHDGDLDIVYSQEVHSKYAIFWIENLHK